MRTSTGTRAPQNSSTQVAEDDAFAAAAVDDILASRGNEPRYGRPLADLDLLPKSDRCASDLPPVPVGGCSPKSVETALSAMYRESSGFWAADLSESSVVAAAADDVGGRPGLCAEATYGEITVGGLRAVLQAVAEAATSTAESGRDADGAPFDAFFDLGAGVGRTAARFLGFAVAAFGVELGPQRFALGCKALAGARSVPGVCEAAQKTCVPRIELLREEARSWVQLVAARSWPSCTARSVIYLGAECFRDNLLDAIAQAVVRGCDAGATVAVLGRRFPPPSAAGKAPHLTAHRTRVLESAGLTMPTWSGSVDVFVHHVRDARHASWAPTCRHAPRCTLRSGRTRPLF